MAAIEFSSIRFFASPTPGLTTPMITEDEVTGVKINGSIFIEVDHEDVDDGLGGTKPVKPDEGALPTDFAVWRKYTSFEDTSAETITETTATTKVASVSQVAVTSTYTRFKVDTHATLGGLLMGKGQFWSLTINNLCEPEDYSTGGGGGGGDSD